MKPILAEGKKFISPAKLKFVFLFHILSEIVQYTDIFYNNFHKLPPIFPLHNMQSLLTKLLLFLTLLKQACQDITLIGSQTPIPSYYLFYSAQAASTHVMSIVGFPNHSILINYYYYPTWNSSQSISMLVNGLVFNPEAKIRTAEFNIYSSLANWSLIYFTKNSIRHFPTCSSMNNLIYNNVSATLLIREVCFGTNKTVIYALFENTVNNSYSLYFFNNVSQQGQTSLTISPVGKAVDSLRFYTDRLLLTLSSRLVLYSCVGFTLGPILLDISFANNSVDYVDAKIYDECLIYATGHNLYIYNLTTQSYIRNYTCPNLIQSVSKFFSYILITSHVSVYQYDYEIGQVIATFAVMPTNSTLLKAQILEADRLILFEENANSGRQFQMFNLTLQYQLNSSASASCYQTYTLTGAICIKDPNSFPLTPVSPVSPVTNATTVLLPQLEQPYSSFADKSLSSLAIEILGYFFSLSMTKTMPKFILVFALFINDLVYYRYHRKFQPQYPNSTLIFMQKFDLLRQLSINSLSKYAVFLDNTRETFSDNNQNALKLLQFTEHDPQGAYFLYSTSDLQMSILICTALYLAIKFAHFLLFMAKSKSKVLRKCYRFFRLESRWWVVFVAIVESNINELAFSCSLQLLALTSNTFSDKANILAMCLVFFIVVAYSLSCYSLIYAIQKRKCSKTMIIYLNHKEWACYFLEPVLVLTRSTIKSFFHGYLIHSYPTQIISLLVIDMLFLIACFRLCRRFTNKLVAFLVLLYFLGFTLFDLYFVLEIYTSLNKTWDRQLIGFILCCTLTGISLLLSLVFFMSSIFDIFKLMKKFFTKSKVNPSLNRQQAEKKNLNNIKSLLKVSKIHNSSINHQDNTLVFKNQKMFKKLKFMDKESNDEQKKHKKQYRVKFKQAQIDKLTKLRLAEQQHRLKLNKPN